MEANVIQYIQNSLRSNWEELAFTDYKGNTYQYRDVARSIARLHLLLKAAGINPGDKIALCGKNSSAWAMTFPGFSTPEVNDNVERVQYQGENVECLFSAAPSIVGGQPQLAGEWPDGQGGIVRYRLVGGTWLIY